jgi:hypothetical protein
VAAGAESLASNVTTPRRRLSVATIVLLAASAARAASPLDDLVAPKPASSACFARVYDAEHLRKHPKQTTTSMAVRLAYDKAYGEPPVLAPPDLGIAIKRRGEPDPLFAQGGCIWGESVNRDISDRRLIKDFKKEAGAGCMMSARPDVFDVASAEEGGYLILDPGGDGKSVTVYLQNYLTMVKQKDRAKQLYITFGADDRVFLLQRAPANDCDFVERVLTR